MSVFPVYSQSNETATTHTEAATNTARSAGTSIRPFHFYAPQQALDDLRRRIAATKWPERETVGDASQGVQFATIRKLASYWESDYDWRTVEAKLNALPQFVTNIDGLDIHFIHVRSKNPNALPLIVDSVIEDLLDAFSSQRGVFVEVADDFSAQRPEVVDVSLNGFGRQLRSD